MTPYKHTQIGWMILIALALALTMIVLLRVIISISEARVAFAVVIVVLSTAMILFASLTVVVDDEKIQVRFGPGLIRKQFRLADVAGCRSVRNRWWYGWGIRLIPGGWLFNVSGLAAVEVKLRSGKTYRIGTDEPQELSNAIESKLDQSRH
jgi:hypothetical protein